MDNTKIVLMDWQNIRSKIGQHEILHKNGVITGSALFILEFENIEEIRKINDFNMIITDYSNHYAKHPIIIEESWIERGQNAYVNPQIFVVDKDGNTTN